MFHEVRIKSPDGTLKKVISEKKLTDMYWDNFQKTEDSICLISTGRKPVPTWVKQSLDLLYPDTHEINH